MARRRNKSKVTNLLEILVILFLMVVSIGGLFLNDTYKPSEEAAKMVAHPESIMEKIGGVTVTDDFWACEPDATPKAGIILYPGALVDSDSYAPLMTLLAERGIIAVKVNMPMDLAILDKKAADEVLAYYNKNYPDLAWYIGGHSLGGSMAGSYVADHQEEFAGLVLLASYITEDISGSELRVLSLMGSEDGVLSQKRYEENRKNLPADFTEFVIEGGCHAGFGDYGIQKGDNTPSITSTEQIAITAEQIATWMGL